MSLELKGAHFKGHFEFIFILKKHKMKKFPTFHKEALTFLAIINMETLYSSKDASINP